MTAQIQRSTESFITAVAEAIRENKSDPSYPADLVGQLDRINSIVSEEKFCKLLENKLGQIYTVVKLESDARTPVGSTLYEVTTDTSSVKFDLGSNPQNPVFIRV